MIKILDLFRRKKPEPQKEKLMQYFSEEYLEKLVNEHKFLQASINRLRKHSALYAQDVSNVPLIATALNNFYVRKLELEVQIDELRDFLTK